jgi:hypothetical protein
VTRDGRKKVAPLERVRSESTTARTVAVRGKLETPNAHVAKDGNEPGERLTRSYEPHPPIESPQGRLRQSGEEHEKRGEREERHEERRRNSRKEKPHVQKREERRVGREQLTGRAHEGREPPRASG